MIHIATSVNESYFEGHSKAWIDSVLKNKPEGVECTMFQVGFHKEIEGVNCIPVDVKNSTYSKHPTVKNRSNYICLESGEFVQFMDCQDDDIVILSDFDVVLQRQFWEEEKNLLNDLGEFEFGLTPDNYVNSTLGNASADGYLGIRKIFDDVQDNWMVYNAGIQVARISAWKKLFEEWKPLIGLVHSKCSHHAAGQMLFNYIVNKNGMVKRFPDTFHNASWFDNTPSYYKNDQLYVGEDLVLFNHHKWIRRVNF